MHLPSFLLLFAGTIYALLGGIHALWTLADVRRPRRFAPSDPDVRKAMERSTVRMTKGRATMWDAWLGFNISHGLGAVVFGVLTIIVGAFHRGLLATPLVLSALVLVSLAYLALAIRFWFSAPVLGAALATTGLILALALTIAGG